MLEKSWYKGKRKNYTYVCFFCYTINKLRFKRGSNRLFFRVTNLQKQLYTFANKSVYFYVMSWILHVHNTSFHFKEVRIVIKNGRLYFLSTEI